MVLCNYRKSFGRSSSSVYFNFSFSKTGMQGRGEQEERILLTWPNFQIEVFAHWKARQLI